MAKIKILLKHIKRKTINLITGKIDMKETTKIKTQRGNMTSIIQKDAVQWDQSLD